MHRDYAVTEIPGVIAAGQKWVSIWTGTGNNADGILASKDGGIMAAQNTNSDVMLIDKNNKVSFPYKDTNTGGALAMTKKGALFVIERGLGMGIEQLLPKRQMLANMYNGEPLECAGGLVNDMTAASNGGVYFTMGGLYYASPAGVVTKYGENLNTNGVILSPDEKTLYVTNGATLAAFDVQPDGSLKNQREFVKLQAGGDGSTVDAMGRIYVTVGNATVDGKTMIGGVQVISPDGKSLGLIQSPLPLITSAFSGKDKKVLYGVANTQRFDEIFTIPMIAQGYKGRAK